MPRSRGVHADFHLGVGGSHLILAPEDDVLLLARQRNEALEQPIRVDEVLVDGG